MDYTNLNSQLTGRCKNTRKLANNTYAERKDNGDIAIRLHATDIMLFKPDGSIRLDAGGRWQTVTTKARINDYLPGPWRITQSRGQWYLTKAGKTWEDVCGFADGLVIAKDGTITGGTDLSESRERLKLRGRVRRFALQYIDALKSGEIEAPGAGDCFFCGMRTVDGHVPLGEATKDTSHILSHLEEPYFVPSMLVRATEVFGTSIMAKSAMASGFRIDGAPEVTAYPDFVWKDLSKVLTRYVLRQVGQAS